MVHAVGLIVTAAISSWMLARSLPETNGTGRVVPSIYVVGLIAVFGASAAYDLCRPGRPKAMLRFLDHAAIFVMIAGSYTAYALHVLPPHLGVPLCIAVWSLAAIGVAPSCSASSDPAASRSCYISAWLAGGLRVAVADRDPAHDCSRPAAVGRAGLFAGTLIHVWERLRFHNASWHAMVLAAVLLHLAAITLLFAPGVVPYCSGSTGSAHISPPASEIRFGPRGSWSGDPAPTSRSKISP